MTRHRALSVLALALLVTPLFTLPAQAGQFHFSVGAGFRIGGLHFNLVLGHSDHHHGYYFRTADPFSYGHLSCSDRCFRDGGYTYHDRSCPLVRHHLDRYHVDGRWLFDSGHLDGGVDWGVDEAVVQLIADESTAGAIVVGVWTTPELRSREYTPQRP
ncbi:MAG TPA: hypothetical protein PK413_08035, partial [Thermoanaerobaculia bacterium]|nr:hypothetical protein [Thermoanaerobaculia bacterium]